MVDFWPILVFMQTARLSLFGRKPGRCMYKYTDFLGRIKAL